MTIPILLQTSFVYYIKLYIWLANILYEEANRLIRGTFTLVSALEAELHKQCRNILSGQTT